MGFLACSALKPGGGRSEELDVDVDCSVAYPLFGTRIARADTWDGKSLPVNRRVVALTAPRAPE